jgi:hypothetical protein
VSGAKRYVVASAAAAQQPQAPPVTDSKPLPASGAERPERRPDGIPPEGEHKRVAAAARGTLGDDAFDQAWREGSAIDLEDAVCYALNVY